MCGDCEKDLDSLIERDSYSDLSDEQLAELSRESHLPSFKKSFLTELSKLFKTSSFLCNHCIDDFLKKWDGFAIINSEFKESEISLSSFYYQSSLYELYKEDDFDIFVDMMGCSRCENGDITSIWPYPNNLDVLFDLYDDELKAVAKLAEKCPFAILTDDFASKIYSMLKQLSEKSTNLCLDFKFYRCRNLDDEAVLFSRQDMGPVPDEKAQENRFNHTGYGYLYLATTEDVSFGEVTYSSNGPRKKQVCMAEIRLLKSLKILDLTDVQGNNHKDDTYQMLICSPLVYNHPDNKNKFQNKMYATKEYIFTRFIADCALSLGFDGIKYASRFGRSGDNFVIFKDKTNKQFKWDEIFIIDDIYRYPKNDDD
ncbi:RES family NAD+ phosphorylase [Methanolobus zinderi]|uniref:RES family NAD+ phosphorylase n=1 Tax=Methanolobus zinderi TaxID=536044 RepID=A0A7D5E8Z5_9EURY|nr:RES family NAD+ phosphorylase [Methanolobus zinderi]QLC50077.1 RES family NAD+ phosphorylase [Methanolobus zinderi]